MTRQDWLAIVGACCVVGGVWWWYAPAGLASGGLAILYVWYRTVNREKP